MISLYLHIPFCTKKCDYCHFYVLPDKDPFKVQLLEGLKREWDLRLPLLQNKEIVSIYFGGGTPALLGAEAIAQVLDWIHSSTKTSHSPEITLEANPENITQALMSSYKDAGINRVSIGLQTLDDPLLKILGRLHTAKEAIEAVLHTYEAGIKNISVDLMYDLPQQTLAHWRNTLEEARQLPITHLSLYNLTIEPHTGFYKHQEKIRRDMPDPEASLAMYELAIAMLEEKGLMQYEISAFAKDNFYSRHNIGYWTARPFLGFGPSAFSYWEGKRFRNVAHLNRYCKALEKGEFPLDFSEELDPIARRRELLAVQLRLKTGVSLSAFQKVNGTFDAETLSALSRLEQQGYLSRHHDLYTLTKHGILFYDTVAAEIV